MLSLEGGKLEICVGPARMLLEKKKNRARKTSGVRAGSGEQLDLFQEFLPILPAGGMRSKCSRTFQ